LHRWLFSAAADEPNAQGGAVSQESSPDEDRGCRRSWARAATRHWTALPGKRRRPDALATRQTAGGSFVFRRPRGRPFVDAETLRI